MYVVFQAADSIGQVDTVAVMIEEAGGVDKIEQLQQHENEDVYNAAYNIIDKYFSAEVGTCLRFTKNKYPRYLLSHTCTSHEVQSVRRKHHRRP